MQRICEIGGEGGPFLIVDREVAETWNGAAEESSDYEQVYGLNAAGGAVVVGHDPAVVWDAGGAATFTVFQDDGVLVLDRSFGDSTAVPPATPPPTGAVDSGSLDVSCGSVVIVWSPFGWTDVTDESMWSAPGPEGFAELHSPPMANIGAQIPVESGRYRCLAASADDHVRCWAIRTAGPDDK